MSEPYVGQVIAVGFNFAPDGWLLCNGQLLSIAQYSTLYNLIGTTYGGDGQQTFAVPNLCGRVPIGQGTGPGLSTYVLGQTGGSETITLTANQIGSHSHTLLASAQAGAGITPGPTQALAQGAQPVVSIYNAAAAANTTLAPAAIGPAGGSQPHENRQPFLTITYIIAAFGIYPSQG